VAEFDNNRKALMRRPNQEHSTLVSQPLTLAASQAFRDGQKIALQSKVPLQMSSELVHGCCRFLTAIVAF
jgi:hypothetical protein